MNISLKEYRELKDTITQLWVELTKLEGEHALLCAYLQQQEKPEPEPEVEDFARFKVGFTD